MNKLEMSKNLIEGFKNADGIVIESIYYTLRKLVTSNYGVVRVIVTGNGLESRKTGNYAITMYAELDKHYSESELKVFLMYCVSNLPCVVKLHTNVVDRMSENEINDILVRGIVIYGDKVFE